MLPGDRVYVRLPSHQFDSWCTHAPGILVELTNQEASVRLQDHTLITIDRRRVLTKAEFKRHLKDRMGL